MIDNKYEKYSNDRKRLQDIGEAPDWLSTAGYQMLVDKKYLLDNETPNDAFIRLAKRASDLVPDTVNPELFGFDNWYDAFYNDLSKGWLSPSTPVLSNLGTNRGHPIACSGTFVEDSIRGFYEARMEVAQLTQRGYGTSLDLSNIRHRGSPISSGGKATGVTQLMNGIVKDMQEISQGTRRGSCGQYLDVLHPDFNEVNRQLISDDEGLNIGWTITDEYEALSTVNPERADDIWKKMMKTKLTKGKGYFFFKDKVNRHRPKMYIDRGLSVSASNLCTEIALFADKDHTFSCVLSSVNISKYDEWKDSKLIERSCIFLDAVIDDMLEKAEKEIGFEKIVRFTEKTRALGLGVLGLSTYYQMKGWSFGDIDSMGFNSRFFKQMKEKTLKASKYMAEVVGEPEWLKGYGERWSHRTALPPTMSTSIIQGGVSLGIEPVFANVYVHDTSAGGVYRVNPPFLKLMKDKGVYSEETMTRIANNNGSVQDEDWLSKEEKLVFRTAFEVSQETILQMAAIRQQYICQGQSINLFFDNKTTEREITRIHDIAFKDEMIHGLYYIRSLNGVAKHKASSDECLSCHG